MHHLHSRVHSVRGHSPRPVASHGSLPPGRTPRASEASPPSSPTLSRAHLPLQVSAPFFTWESVSKALPGPGFG